MNKNDWRIRNQEEYLMNKTLYLHNFCKQSPMWDHEHCEFCFEKIMENSNKAYSTLDDCYWICKACYEDFKQDFGLSIFIKEQYPLRDLKEILRKEIGRLQNKDLFSLVRVIALLQRLGMNFEFEYPVTVVPVGVRLSANRKKSHEIIDINIPKCECKMINAEKGLKDLKR